MNKHHLRFVRHIEFVGILGCVCVIKCTVTGGYLTWLRAESVLQNTSEKTLAHSRSRVSKL